MFLKDAQYKNFNYKLLMILWDIHDHFPKSFATFPISKNSAIWGDLFIPCHENVLLPNNLIICEMLQQEFLFLALCNFAVFYFPSLSLFKIKLVSKFKQIGLGLGIGIGREHRCKRKSDISDFNIWLWYFSTFQLLYYGYSHSFFLCCFK